ncbi:MAG: 3-dehydroquinate synthase [Alteromonadaceae bacterium]|jgi:3-dehydroquinate synthase
MPQPGSSNKRFRFWFAPLTKSNLIRYVGAQASAKDSFLLVILASMAVPVGAWLIKLGWQYLTQTALGPTSAANSPFSIQRIDANFKLSHHYPVLFENQVFDCANSVLCGVLNQHKQDRQQVFVYVDDGVNKGNPQLCQQISTYFQHHRSELTLVAPPQVIAGGEAAKQYSQIEQMYQQMLRHQLDRHSCVLVAVQYLMRLVLPVQLFIGG